MTFKAGQAWLSLRGAGGTVRKVWRIEDEQIRHVVAAL